MLKEVVMAYKTSLDNELTLKIVFHGKPNRWYLILPNFFFYLLAVD